MRLQAFVMGVVLLVGGLLITPSFAQAQVEIKIAVVDARRALISSKKGMAAEKKLKALMESKKREIEPLEASLKRKQEEFESQKYVISKSAADDRRLELIKEERDLERRMREAQDELELEQRKLMQPMLKAVEETLSKLGKEMNFAVILEKSSPGVLYTDPTLDITDLVIERMNK
jgi:outer membrane protein